MLKNNFCEVCGGPTYETLMRGSECADPDQCAPLFSEIPTWRILTIKFSLYGPIDTDLGYLPEYFIVNPQEMAVQVQVVSCIVNYSVGGTIKTYTDGEVFALRAGGSLKLTRISDYVWSAA